MSDGVPHSLLLKKSLGSLVKFLSSLLFRNILEILINASDKRRKKSSLVDKTLFVFDMGKLSLVYISTKTSNCLNGSDKVHHGNSQSSSSFLNIE